MEHEGREFHLILPFKYLAVWNLEVLTCDPPSRITDDPAGSRSRILGLSHFTRDQPDHGVVLGLSHFSRDQPDHGFVF